ncbi:hypothetical protein ASZ90_006407 [hydrocarbon metagenome]|uniref:Uncharacterized protein n=1 Tax=hydrocarbon metagenome TaxID=938273 RepID=A0A0W8FU73_9ZZZZ
MTVTSSAIFDYLRAQNKFFIERNEIASYDFSVLRKNLRLIIKNLHECDAYATEISNTLRTKLSEWLTVPVPFDDEMVKAIACLGSQNAVANKWGCDIGVAYEAALIAANELCQNENPMRYEIRSEIENLKAQGKRFKIFCHRLARPYFLSIDETIDPDLFIHSSKDYRRVTPFDVLIKVGPLRSRGWGGSPDALLTAPRFSTLAHFIWSGCTDEQGFGLDPASGTVNIEVETPHSLTSSMNATSRGISWASNTKKIGSNADENGLPLFDEDEFQMFQSMVRTYENRPAILFQLDDQHGILYPQRMQLLSFEPFASNNEQIGHRLPGETLTEGVFLIFPILGDVDLPELHAKDGTLSPIWKQRLITECKRDKNRLCEKLFDSGIELLSLHSRVNDWCKAATTVIPAPQKAEHFRILIDVLGVYFEQRSDEQKQRLQWWQYAWKEIQHSRGEAISEGRFGQEIIEEKIDTVLHELRTVIESKCKCENNFYIEIPSNEELEGRLLFYKIISVEDGFLAPDMAIKKICDLGEFEQWRV